MKSLLNEKSDFTRRSITNNEEAVSMTPTFSMENPFSKQTFENYIAKPKTKNNSKLQVSKSHKELKIEQDQGIHNTKEFVNSPKYKPDDPFTTNWIEKHVFGKKNVTIEERPSTNGSLRQGKENIMETIFSKKKNQANSIAKRKKNDEKRIVRSESQKVVNSKVPEKSKNQIQYNEIHWKKTQKIQSNHKTKESSNVYKNSSLLESKKREWQDNLEAKNKCKINFNKEGKAKTECSENYRPSNEELAKKIQNLNSKYNALKAEIKQAGKMKGVEPKPEIVSNQPEIQKNEKVNKAFSMEQSKLQNKLDFLEKKINKIKENLDYPKNKDNSKEFEGQNTQEVCKLFKNPQRVRGYSAQHFREEDSSNSSKTKSKSPETVKEKQSLFHNPESNNKSTSLQSRIGRYEDLFSNKFQENRNSMKALKNSQSTCTINDLTSNLGNNVNASKNYSKVRNSSDSFSISEELGKKHNKEGDQGQKNKKNAQNSLKELVQQMKKDDLKMNSTNFDNGIRTTTNANVEMEEKHPFKVNGKKLMSKNVFFKNAFPNNKNVQSILSSNIPAKSSEDIYQISSVIRSFFIEKSSYFTNLFREHFIQTIQSIFFSKILKPCNEKILFEKRISLTKKEKQINKKTVIFDLDETLVHCNESSAMQSDIILPITFPSGDIIEVLFYKNDKQQAGINIRPYTRECLKELSKHFEIIVFTASHKCYANEVINALDPKGEYIQHRLFRENCIQSEEGAYIKDLRIFENRNLKDLIIIDNTAYSFGQQIENGIPIIPFQDSKDDKELLNLMKFLISIKNTQDIRELFLKVFKFRFFSDYTDPYELIQALYCL